MCLTKVYQLGFVDLMNISLSTATSLPSLIALQTVNQAVPTATPPPSPRSFYRGAPTPDSSPEAARDRAPDAAPGEFTGARQSPQTKHPPRQL